VSPSIGPVRAVILALTAVAILLAGAAGPAVLAHLLPALLLIALLAAGRYPGERRLARSRREARPPRAAATRPPAPAIPAAWAPRGGLLMARGLAVRPPPRGAALPV
jgi:hypothetical protein